MKTKPKEASPVDRLLTIVWENTLKATGHSWERLNHAMHAALKLAIGAGFEFETDDMKQVMANYRTGYWIGDPEWCYSMAIGQGNLSAAKSYEAWKAREPFIADDVDIGRHWNNEGFAHSVSGRVKERLAAWVKRRSPASST